LPALPPAEAPITLKYWDVDQSTSNEFAFELPVLVIVAEMVVVAPVNVWGRTDKLIDLPAALAGNASAASHDSNPARSTNETAAVKPDFLDCM
jgi:hypothetical protein